MDTFHGEHAGLSAQTQWTRALSRYSDIQKSAVDYAVRCDAALSEAVLPCDVVVDDMAAIDRVARVIPEDGEEALIQDDTDKLENAIGHLDAVTDQLTFTLMRGDQP
jgi:mannose-1-phosphate guanylyltransferase